MSSKTPSFLFTNLKCFQPQVAHGKRHDKPSLRQILFGLLDPTHTGGDKERRVRDSCCGRLLFAILAVVDCSLRPKRALLARQGIRDTKGNSRTDREVADQKGMIGPKWNSSPIRASWPERTTSSRKDNFVVKGY